MLVFDASNGHSAMMIRRKPRIKRKEAELKARVTQQFFDEVKSLADELDWPVSLVVREAVVDYIGRRSAVRTFQHHPSQQEKSGQPSRRRPRDCSEQDIRNSAARPK